MAPECSCKVQHGATKRSNGGVFSNRVWRLPAFLRAPRVFWSFCASDTLLSRFIRFFTSHTLSMPLFRLRCVIVHICMYPRVLVFLNAPSSLSLSFFFLVGAAVRLFPLCVCVLLTHSFVSICRSFFLCFFLSVGLVQCVFIASGYFCTLPPPLCLPDLLSLLYTAAPFPSCTYRPSLSRPCRSSRALRRESMSLTFLRSPCATAAPSLDAVLSESAV